MRIAYNKFMEFRDWLNKKFIEWRGDSRKTISEYAEWLGISQPQLSEYMSFKKNKVPRSPKIIDLFYARYGAEIYDVLTTLDDGLDELGSGFAKSFRCARSESSIELKNRGVSATSPEGKEIMKMIFSGFGITLNETE